MLQATFVYTQICVSFLESYSLQYLEASLNQTPHFCGQILSQIYHLFLMLFFSIRISKHFICIHPANHQDTAKISDLTKSKRASGAGYYQQTFVAPPTKISERLLCSDDHVDAHHGPLLGLCALHAHPLQGGARGRLRRGAGRGGDGGKEWIHRGGLRCLLFFLYSFFLGVLRRWLRWGVALIFLFWKAVGFVDILCSDEVRQ